MDAFIKLPPATVRPHTLAPPPSDVCWPDKTLLADTVADPTDDDDDDNDDDEVSSNGSDSLSILPRPFRCEDGPVRVSVFKSL